MRKRTDRIVAVVLLLLQMAMLTFVPASRAAAASPIGMDLCRAASAMTATQNTPGAPAVPHSTHACGDCCTAHAGPVPAADDSFLHVAPLSPAGANAHVAAASGRSATVLPPACGPPTAA